MNTTATDTFERMDSMYRYQRYFYDATRKFYLLGRDQLLDRIDADGALSVVEIGCGTGRNLEILASRRPERHYYGLDASAEMLETAAAKLSSEEITNVRLETALAGDFHHRLTFGRPEPFDAAFFSYSISMIPDWRSAFQNAIANVRPGGAIYIVDFYDQQGLPVWFQRLLKWWLSKFHVRFWDELMPYLHSLERNGQGSLEIVPVARRYAFLAEFRRL